MEERKRIKDPCMQTDPCSMGYKVYKGEKASVKAFDCSNRIPAAWATRVTKGKRPQSRRLTAANGSLQHGQQGLQSK
eukprot:1158620-Pelagomonas_calceolata.AAC.6